MRQLPTSLHRLAGIFRDPPHHPLTTVKASAYSRATMQVVPQYISPQDAADRLSVSVRTVFQYAKDGRLKRHKLGRKCTRFLASEVASLAVNFPQSVSVDSSGTMGETQRP